MKAVAAPAERPEAIRTVSDLLREYPDNPVHIPFSSTESAPRRARLVP